MPRVDAQLAPVVLDDRVHHHVDRVALLVRVRARVRARARASVRVRARARARVGV